MQNEEHFVCHETREAATDPVNGWWDSRTGEEADDKCAWSPTPFIGTDGYGYQYEWSNADQCASRPGNGKVPRFREAQARPRTDIPVRGRAIVFQP